MKRLMNEKEFAIIMNELAELGYGKLMNIMSIDNSYINGVTVFETNDSPQGKLIRYIEDDICDEYGNPYFFEYTYYKMFGEITPGKRFISIYVGRHYVIIPVTGQSYLLVGAVDIEKAGSVDKGKSVKIPTPLALDLPKENARPVVESDIRDIKYAVKTYGKYKAGSVIGTIALSILFIIVIGLVYIFTITGLDDSGKLTDNLFFALSGVALVLLIAGIVWSWKFFKNIYLRNALKMKYIKKVMVVGIDKHIPVSAGMSGVIGFYEWVDGKIVYSSNEIGIGTQFLEEGVKYGDIINMLTIEANQEHKLVDSRIFCSIKEK